MKKAITLFSVSIGLLIATSTQAKIWRVNNTGVPADFTSIQQAHDGPMVLSGDTFHLEPSINSYGPLNAYKRMIIIGPGYYLAQNFGLQANVSPAIMDNAYMGPGTDGSVITGVSLISMAINASNVMFVRNKVSDVVYISTSGSTNTSNIVIAQNVIGMYGISHDFSSGHGVSNVLIANNIVNGYITLGSLFSGILENNVIIASYVNVENFIIRNNIFNSTGTIVSTNGSIIYNIADCGGCLPVGNGNQNGIASYDVFVSSGTSDGQYQLKSASPALGAGQGGVDCGIFGGSNAYKLSGVPAIPAIYDLNVPVNSNGDQLPITISVRSNN